MLKLSQFKKRLGLLTACAISTVALTGCLSTSNPDKIQSVPTPVAPITVLPHDPVLLPDTALSALQGEGLSYFDKTEWNRFAIKASKNTYVPNLVKGDPKANSLGWGTGAVGVLTHGQITEPENIAWVDQVDPQTLNFHFKSSPLTLTVKLVPYDVSGLPIKYFLRTRSDKPTDIAYFMGNEVFPAGSVAWKAFLSVNQNQLFVTTKSGFTGADTIENFTDRFTKKTPYCIGYTPGTNAQPIGLRFDMPIVKQITKDNKGRKVEKAQQGLMQVWKTKPNSIFCQVDAKENLTTARWSLGYVNGTRTLTFAFPPEISPYSLGIRPSNANGLQLSIAEVINKKKTKVVPAVLWLKDRPIEDPQWRFNMTAATAVDKAITQALPKLHAWKEANESELAKRSKSKRVAGQAKK